MKYYIIFIAWEVSSFDSSYFITKWMVWKKIDTQYMSWSYIAFMVKMESAIKINIFDFRQWPKLHFSQSAEAEQ